MVFGEFMSYDTAPIVGATTAFVIIGGLRSGTLQVMATVTIASYAGLSDLGGLGTSGIGLNDYNRILRKALLVTALAMLVEALFALGQRLTATKGVTEDRSTKRSSVRWDVATTRAFRRVIRRDLAQCFPAP